MRLQTWNFRSLYVSISSFIFATTLVKICSGLSTKKNWLALKWKGLKQEASRGHCPHLLTSCAVVWMIAKWRSVVARLQKQSGWLCARRARPCTHKVWCCRNYVHKPMCNCRKQFALQWVCRGRSGGPAAGIPSQKPAINTRFFIHRISNSYNIFHTLPGVLPDLNHTVVVMHRRKNMGISFSSLFMFDFTKVVSLTKIIFSGT